MFGSDDSTSEALNAVAENVNAEEVTENTEAVEGTEASETEKPEVEAKPEDKQEKLFASKFAALSRKEKQIKQREQQIESRMAELEEKLQAMNKPEPEAEQVEEEPLEIRLKKDPFETLKQLGLPYDVLTQIALNDGKLTPEMQIELTRREIESKYEKKFKTIEEQLAEKERLATEREQQQEEAKHAQIIEGFKTQLAQHIEAKATDYELLSVEGQDGVELVYQVIAAHHEETGEVLDSDEAAALVEEHLLEEAKKRVGLSKIKQLLGTGAEAQNPAQKPQQKQSVTLSNSQSQVVDTGSRNLSDEESKREVAKLIRWVE